MNKECLLCKHYNADKTGSHIIPSFFMKRINGDGKRDHEIGFEIKNGLVDSYFGRDVYEDQRRAGSVPLSVSELVFDKLVDKVMLQM